MIVVFFLNLNCYVNKFHAEKNNVRFLKYRSIRWVSEQVTIHNVSSLNGLDNNSTHVYFMYINPHAPNNNFFISILSFYTHRYFILLPNSKF